MGDLPAPDDIDVNFAGRPGDFPRRDGDLLRANDLRKRDGDLERPRLLDLAIATSSSLKKPDNKTSTQGLLTALHESYQINVLKTEIKTSSEPRSMPMIHYNLDIITTHWCRYTSQSHENYSVDVNQNARQHQCHGSRLVILTRMRCRTLFGKL